METQCRRGLAGSETCPDTCHMPRRGTNVGMVETPWTGRSGEAALAAHLLANSGTSQSDGQLSEPESQPESETECEPEAEQEN